MFRHLNNLSLFKFAINTNNQHILKPFGIVNPNIVRNLSYNLLFTLEYPNTTNSASTMSPQTHKQEEMNCQALAHLSPTVGPKQGTICLLLQPFTNFQAYRNRSHPWEVNRLGPYQHAYACNIIPNHWGRRA